MDSKVIVSSSQCLHQSYLPTVVFGEFIHCAEIVDTSTLYNCLSLSISKHLLVGYYLPVFRRGRKGIVWKSQWREMVLQKRVKESIRVSMRDVVIVLCVRDKHGSSNVLWSFLGGILDASWQNTYGHSLKSIEPMHHSAFHDFYTAHE